MTLDIEQLMTDIKDTVSGILNRDVATVRGFSSRQLRGIANQASLIAAGIASGEITEATRSFFLEQLIELSQNFANTLVGLVIATIEKIWNAIVGVLWSTISKATGIQLPAFNPL